MSRLPVIRVKKPEWHRLLLMRCAVLSSFYLLESGLYRYRDAVYNGRGDRALSPGSFSDNIRCIAVHARYADTFILYSNRLPG